MPSHVVTCIRRCYDGKTKRRYYPGDTDKIDSLAPVAVYFTGFPPGTEVYHKERGNKNKFVNVTTKIVPGAVVDLEPATPVAETPAVVEPAAPAVVEPAAPAVVEPAATFLCDICNKFTGKSAASLAAHKHHCVKKLAASVQE